MSTAIPNEEEAKNTPAYVDQRNAPIRRFLLRKLPKMKLSGLKWAVVMCIANETYGWADRSAPKIEGKAHRRLDRNRFSYQEVAEHLECSVVGVRRAVRALVEMNILTEYIKPHRGDKGVYGINSNFKEWVNLPRKKLEKSANESQSFEDETDHEAAPFVSPSSTKWCQNSPEKPHNEAVSATPNIISNIIRSPLPPKGGVRPSAISDRFRQEEDLGEVIPEIANRSEALANQAMDFETAVVNAERAYSRRYPQGLSPRERGKLGDFFRRSPFLGSLLAIWFDALPLAQEDRMARKRDPERARYVAKSPFKDCLQIAAEAVEEGLWQKERARLEALANGSNHSAGAAEVRFLRHEEPPESFPSPSAESVGFERKKLA